MLFDLKDDQKLTYNQFISLCLDFKKIISKEILWNTFKFLKDPEKGKITLQSVSKVMEIQFNYNTQTDKMKKAL